MGSLDQHNNLDSENNNDSPHDSQITSRGGNQYTAGFSQSVTQQIIASLKDGIRNIELEQLKSRVSAIEIQFVSQIRAASVPIPSGGHNFPYNTLYGVILLVAYLYIQYLSIKPVQLAFPFIKGSLELPNTRVTLSISTTMLLGLTPQIHTCKVNISLKITRLSTVYHSHTIRYPVCHTRMFTPTYKHIPRDKVEEGITHVDLWC